MEALASKIVKRVLAKAIVRKDKRNNKKTNVKGSKGKKTTSERDSRNKKNTSNQQKNSKDPKAPRARKSENNDRRDRGKTGSRNEGKPRDKQAPTKAAGGRQPSPTKKVDAKAEEELDKKIAKLRAANAERERKFKEAQEEAAVMRKIEAEEKKKRIAAEKERRAEEARKAKEEKERAVREAQDEKRRENIRQEELHQQAIAQTERGTPKQKVSERPTNLEGRSVRKVDICCFVCWNSVSRPSLHPEDRVWSVTCVIEKATLLESVPGKQ
eukprot:m.140101 g.140101  ORF g.140101 m.140101 type:complete len:270 (+) comp14818_c1_seq1:71-880(+)